MIFLAVLLLSFVPQQDPVAGGAVMESVREAIQKGEDQQALNLLRDLSDQSPELYTANNLAYLEGVLLERLDRTEEALTVLESLLEGESSVRDQVLVHLIRVSDDLPLEKRLPFFEEYLQHWRKHPLWLETAFEFARLLDAGGSFAEAKTWYDRVWRVRQRPLSREAALGHALLHFKTDEDAVGVRDLEKLIEENDSDDVALEAVRALEGRVDLDDLSEDDLRARVQVYMNNRDGEKARAYLGRLVSRYPRSSSLDQYGYLRGRSFVIEERFAEALAAYGETYEKFPGTSWGLLCGYQLGNTALRKKEFSRAVEDYRGFLKAHPGSKYSARAYFNLAEALLWMGNRSEASKVAEEAARRYKGGDRRTFLYQLARISLDEGQWKQALAYIDKLDHLSSRQLPSGVTREEIYFLKGRCLEKLGQEDAAREAFLVAVSGRPNYFSYLSRQSLGVSDPVKPFTGDDTWPLKLLGPREFYESTDLSPGRLQIPSVERVREFLFLGLLEEAAVEISRVGSSSFPGGRIDRLYNLSYYAARGGWASRAVQAAESLRRLVSGPGWPEESPPSLREIYYPRHYWPEIRSAAEEFGVPADLVLSVIRQESVFQPDAKSPVAARGLMQFMMTTAREQAQRLGIPAPEPEDLYRPELSIRLGTFYLGQLIHEFDGSLEMALAAYNGGAYNVKRWAEKLPDPVAPGMFVSNIGYRETKLYVLKVLGNYYGYRSVYGDTVPTS